MFTSFILNNPSNGILFTLEPKDLTATMTSYLEKFPENGPKAHKCSICNQVTSDRSSGIKHVENIHFAGQLSYNCKYCDQTFSSRNNMYVHISRNHK